MNRLFFRRFTASAVVALAASAFHWQAGAGPLSPTDEEQVRAVIVQQFEAFADDDADRAFETAAPGVREAIGNPGRFLALVRGAYPMVYRPSSVSFLKPEEEEGQVLQLVQITDDDDKSWLALFALERQPDTSWRISGCVVSENLWKSI